MAKTAFGTQPERGARGQHQHRPAGVSDAGTITADHAAAAFRLFCRTTKAQPPVPLMSRPVQRPVEITQWDQVLDMLAGHADKSIIPFSSGVPDINQPSLKPLWRELSRVAQHNLKAVLGYDELPCCRELRQQIARLMLDGGSVINADDIVITSGSQSGMSLALLAVCQP